jgi:DNA-binding MarR family transcriptional regulator
MPTFKRWYNRKKPTLQIRILNRVAVNGEMSKKKLKKHLKANYPDVSDAVDALKHKELIVYSHKF